MQSPMSEIATYMRRVEVMKRANHLAEIHYRAWHFWLWFTPISVSIGVVLLLSFANAANVMSVNERAGMKLSVSMGFFAFLAFVLNSLQTYFGWSSHAEVHRVVELELSQGVSFRLEKLRKMMMMSATKQHRANLTQELYRIDVYLQAVQRRTPGIPRNIEAAFGMLASRLGRIAVSYPDAFQMRLSTYNLQAEEKNQLPVEMQIDALDLLIQEMEKYWLYPLYMPNAQDVVSRTIDIFFERPVEGGTGDGEKDGDESTDSSHTDCSDDDDQDRGAV